MIGGIIVGITPQPKAARTLIAVLGQGSEAHMMAGIYIVPTTEPLTLGDSVWWQSRHAYWTPIDRSRQDVPLERISYSFGLHQADGGEQYEQGYA